MDESEDRAEALRLKLQSLRDTRTRVPAELRAEAVAFAKAAHASGESYKSIASTLGLKPDTLMRWCRRGREPKKSPGHSGRCMGRPGRASRRGA